MSVYHKIAAHFPIGATDRKVDIGNIFDQAIDQFPELQGPSEPPTEPPDDDSGDNGDNPWERGRQREKAILSGIERLAEQYAVGPLAPMRIDARGNITMLQKMINPNSYEMDKELPDEMRKLARKYDPDYQGEISGRWIKLNHFTWEKLLSDIGLL